MTTKLVALAILFAGVSVRAGNGIDVVAVYYPHWHKYPKGTEWFGEKWDEGEWAFVRTAVGLADSGHAADDPLRSADFCDNVCVGCENNPE